MRKIEGKLCKLGIYLQFYYVIVSIQFRGLKNMILTQLVKPLSVTFFDLECKPLSLIGPQLEPGTWPRFPLLTISSLRLVPNSKPHSLGPN